MAGPVELADGRRGADVFPRRWLQRGGPAEGVEVSEWIAHNITLDRQARIPSALAGREAARRYATLIAKRVAPC